MLINAPLETAVLRLLANTAVTPNQLTAVCNLIAYVVAALFATGHLPAGAVGAIAVGVADGLDGRQARVQLRTTPLGRLEHLLDKIYEVLWIVALAYAFSGASPIARTSAPLLIWVAAYLLDTAAYDLVKWRTGATLDEASRLDAADPAGRRSPQRLRLHAAGRCAGGTARRGVSRHRLVVGCHRRRAWADAAALLIWDRPVRVC